MSHDLFHSLPLKVQEAILNGPAHIPPPGVVPNLEHPPNRNRLVLIVIIICLTVATIASLLRAYSRIRILRNVSREDYIACIGYIFTVACAACGLCFVYGLGTFVHQWNVRVKDLFKNLHILHIATNFYDISIAALKVAILLEWSRIFAPRGTRGLFYTTCHILLWLNVLFYASKILLINLSCIPHRAIWDKTGPAKCLNQEIVYLVAAAIGVVSHVFILALPQIIIWKLKMSKKQKVGVSIVFATGILTTTAGIFRLISTTQLLISSDVTYTISLVALWGLAELTLLILVYCLPSFPSIFRDITLPTVFSRVPRFRPEFFIRNFNIKRFTNNTSTMRTIATSSYERSTESLVKLHTLGYLPYISAGVNRFNDQQVDDVRKTIATTHLAKRAELGYNDTQQV
ncbi:hypothetical protein GGR55DRAFT_642056 [Xylaria sp. FL0064]|nr:hypothetical protein GGR55DRAFT_642056 [Xylaria sp. FL0064]